MIRLFEDRRQDLKRFERKFVKESLEMI